MANVQLPPPGARYDEDQQRRIHEVIEKEFADRVSVFEDIEAAPATQLDPQPFYGNRIILTSPDGTRYELTVADGGVIGTNAL